MAGDWMCNLVERMRQHDAWMHFQSWKEPTPCCAGVEQQSLQCVFVYLSSLVAHMLWEARSNSSSASKSGCSSLL